ncbi:MAG: capsule biosynthesis GfcC family protein [Glaciecola sp.]
MIKYCHIIILGVSCFIISTTAYSQVSITINDTHYHYPNNPRMSDVLKPVGLASDWYWPSAILFNETSYQQLEDQRNRLIRKMANSGRDDSGIHSDYRALIDQIKSWSLAKRILVNIDYDHARFDIAENPQFDEGKYILNITSRPNTIYVFGAVPAASHIPYSGNQCLAELIKNIQRTSIADKSYVYMVLPDGSIEKSPIANWNNKCVVPAPGTQILIPIQENQFFAENTEINYETALLSLNRKPTK